MRLHDQRILGHKGSLDSGFNKEEERADQQFKKVSCFLLPPSKSFAAGMPDHTSWASSLSVDVWAEIFSMVADAVFDELQQELPRREIYRQQVHLHRQYQSLRLVCKVFQSVFLSHPELSDILFLEERQQPTECEYVLSLLRHLQRDNLTIRTLLAECGETSGLDAVLSGAVTAANRPLQMLATAVIQDCSTMSATLLSTCTSLISCTFTQGQTVLDMSALRALPRLSTLRLEGHDTEKGGFSGLKELLHLTYLDIHRTAVEGAEDQWMFSSSLQVLRIVCSSLRSMHEDGLSQCTMLLSLSLDDCLIECQALEDTLEISEYATYPARLPNNMSALTQLTDLMLTVSTTIHGVFECPWLPELTALKSIYLNFESSTVCFNVTDQMLSLINLQHLGILQGTMRRTPQNTLSLEASLHLLPKLQSVSLHSRFLKLDHRVLELVKLSSLKTLNLLHSQLLDNEYVRCFGRLMHELGAKRPDVVIC